MSSRAKLRCSCDAVGSGVCPDCRALVSRRLDAPRRASGSTEPADHIVKPHGSPVTNAPTDAARSDISSRLHSAANLIADGELPLEAVIDLVTATVLRLQRIAEEERKYASPELPAHNVQVVS